MPRDKLEDLVRETHRLVLETQKRQQATEDLLFQLTRTVRARRTTRAGRVRVNLRGGNPAKRVPDCREASYTSIGVMIGSPPHRLQTQHTPPSA